MSTDSIEQVRRPEPLRDEIQSGKTLWTIEAHDDQPIAGGQKYAADLRVLLLVNGERIREFTYPAYRIWTLLAHWTEGLGDLEAEYAAGSTSNGDAWSAEQTPDIETQQEVNLRRLAEAAIQVTLSSRWHGPTVAQALAPVLAAAVRDAEQRAWDEGYASGAADWDGITLTKREISAASNPYRADRVAEPQHEAATSSNGSGRRGPRFCPTCRDVLRYREDRPNLPPECPRHGDVSSNESEASDE